MSEDNMLTKDTRDDATEYNIAALRQDNLQLRKQIAHLNETLQILIQSDIEKGNRINQLNIELTDTKNCEILKAANAQTAALEAINLTLTTIAIKPVGLHRNEQ